MRSESGSLEPTSHQDGGDLSALELPSCAGVRLADCPDFTRGAIHAPTTAVLRNRSHERRLVDHQELASMVGAASNDSANFVASRHDPTPHPPTNQPTIPFLSPHPSQAFPSPRSCSLDTHRSTIATTTIHPLQASNAEVVNMVGRSIMPTSISHEDVGLAWHRRGFTQQLRSRIPSVDEGGTMKSNQPRHDR